MSLLFVLLPTAGALLLNVLLHEKEALLLGFKDMHFPQY